MTNLIDDDNPDNQPLLSEADAKRLTSHLNDAQGIIDRALNDPVLGKMFVMPDPPPPPMPWEVEEVKGEQ